MVQQKAGTTERNVTPLERLFARSPYSVVTLVARIHTPHPGTR